MSRTFAFIHTGPGIAEDAQKDVRFVARSHTAKVNRRKQALSRRKTMTPTFGIQPTRSAALLTSTGLGAADCITPDLTSPAVADVIDFVFRSALRQAFTPSEIGHWFQGFCEMPLLYHAWSHHHFFIQSRMPGTLVDSRWRGLVTSRISAHRLLQDLLSDPGEDQQSIERVLLAMAITSQHEKDVTAVDDLQLCRPHMLYLEGFDVFRVRQLKGFLPAAAALISRLPNGLRSLVDTGLFRILCMLDLISAAVDFTYPFFPCGWEHSFDFDFTVTGNENAPGYGFLTLGPEALPRLTTFVKLCHLDRYMANLHEMRLSASEFQDLLAWRNAAVHELLSLSPGEELEKYSTTTPAPRHYDCCRLAAIIYTNAVICATPASCKGIIEPLRQLTDLLKQCDFGGCESDVKMVALWSAFVGGLASYGTSYWGYVVQTARSLTKTLEVTTLEEARLILRRFLWSESACDLGARHLWNAMIGEDNMTTDQWTYLL